MLKEREGEFIPVDLLGGVEQAPATRSKTFADAVEGLLRAGWNREDEEDGDAGADDEEDEEGEVEEGAARNNDADIEKGGVIRAARDQMTDELTKPKMPSLASIGAAASRRGG